MAVLEFDGKNCRWPQCEFQLPPHLAAAAGISSMDYAAGSMLVSYLSAAPSIFTKALKKPT